MMPLTTGRLHIVKQALDLNIYETVDPKVKIMIKSENKQPILQGDKTKYKMDSIVADDTGTVKLFLWEDTIDKLHNGKCHHIQNCKIRVFDGSKFLNTNEFTKKTEIDEIPNINLATPELQGDTMVTESRCNSMGLFVIIPIHASCFLLLNAVSKQLVETNFVILYTVVIFYNYCPVMMKYHLQMFLFLILAFTVSR